MKSSICTLFEGNFHKGVAVLINSLYKNGFKGDFYAGYRGDLPKWAEKAIHNFDLDWPGSKTIQLAHDLHVHFLPLDSSHHFTHLKPSFMLRLFNGPAKDADNLAYFDPDIVNLCKWSFYENWMSYGVAMVHEAISNDMPATHPNRMEWYKVIKLINKEPKRDIHSYINAGFCGVAKKHIEFLDVWSQVIDVAISHYKMDPSVFMTFDRTSAFYCIDQDAYNITAMCSASPISEMGPEAMDFENSGWTMSHAVGWPKPWNNKFILSALSGNPPNRPHKNYWNNTNGQISLYSNFYTNLMKVDILVATFIGRFYKRN